MKKKNRYVQRETLTKIKARYIILLGQRSNGKSWSVKEDVIKNALYNNEEFAYIRRYKEDCKQYMVEEYFADILSDSEGHNHLDEWSKGEYNTIAIRNQVIHFAKMDDEGKLHVGRPFGRMFGLSWATHYKSLSFPKITTAVYEEFVTDSVYLSNEVRIFMNLISTIFRERAGRVYLVGNTISRINPFFKEWGLKGVNKQKENSIEYYSYKYKDENGHEKIDRLAVYLTHSTNNNSGMFFGNIAKSITSTVWESDEFPHLEGDINDYDEVYKLVFEYDNNKFFLQFLKADSGDYVWFVSPKTTEIQKGTRVVSNQFRMDSYSTSMFKGLNEMEDKIFNYLKMDKIVYSDNLTATEFKQCYSMTKKVIL